MLFIGKMLSKAEKKGMLKILKKNSLDFFFQMKSQIQKIFKNEFRERFFKNKQNKRLCQ